MDGHDQAQARNVGGWMADELQQATGNRQHARTAQAQPKTKRNKRLRAQQGYGQHYFRAPSGSKVYQAR